MTERHAWLVLTKQIVARILSLVLFTQIARQIMVHELGTIRVEAIYLMGLAERIVDSGVKGSGRDERAELGNWISQMQPYGHFGCGFEIQRRHVPVDVDRVSKF